MGGFRKIARKYDPPMVRHAIEQYIKEKKLTIFGW